MWTVKWGALEEQFKEAAQKRPFGSPLPPALETKPELPDHLDPVWEMFWFLATDRISGFSIGYISILTILTYLDEIGIESRDDRLYYLDMIRAMDLEYVKLHTDTNKPGKKTTKKPADKFPK